MGKSDKHKVLHLIDVDFAAPSFLYNLVVRAKCRLEANHECSNPVAIKGSIVNVGR